MSEFRPLSSFTASYDVQDFKFVPESRNPFEEVRGEVRAEHPDRVSPGRHSLFTTRSALSGWMSSTATPPSSLSVSAIQPETFSPNGMANATRYLTAVGGSFPPISKATLIGVVRRRSFPGMRRMGGISPGRLRSSWLPETARTPFQSPFRIG